MSFHETDEERDSRIRAENLETELAAKDEELKRQRHFLQTCSDVIAAKDEEIKRLRLILRHYDRFAVSMGVKPKTIIDEALEGKS